MVSLAQVQAQVGANWRLRSPKPYAGALISVAALNSTRVIAVGRGTGLMISDDAGVTWTASRIDDSVDFSTDAYVASNPAGTNQVLIVGNKVYTATTGDNWNEVTTNLTSAETLGFVISRGSGWTAIKKTTDPVTGNATYHLVTASVTAANWIEGGALPLFETDSNIISGFVYDGTHYIVGGSYSNSTLDHSQAFLLSTTAGFAWTSTFLTGSQDTLFIHDLATSGSITVAMGDDNAYTSTDHGSTWTRTSVSTMERVAWNGTRFIAAGIDVSQYSTNGTTWTDSTTAYGHFNPLAMTKQGTSIVAVGTGGSIFTTPDGDEWTKREPTGPSEPFTSIVSNPNGVLVATTDSSIIYYSTDGGDTWATDSSGRGDSVAWKGSSFYAVGAADNLYKSADGTNWSVTTGVFFGSSMTAIASDGNTLVAVGDDPDTGASKIFYSTDGATWPSPTLPAKTGMLSSVKRCGTLWVAVGEGSTILTSPNAVTWTKRAPTGANIDLLTVASNPTGTLFVAMGNSGYPDVHYYRSTNGTTWTALNLPTAASMQSVIWTGTGFAALDNAFNRIYLSSDGVTWTIRDLPSGNDLAALTYDAAGKQALIVGDFGEVLSSDLVPEATFAVKTQSVFESAINAVVQVNLTVPPTTSLTVPFAITGTAQSGTDYVAINPASITFAAGETSKAINVTLINDTVAGSNRTMIFTLGSTTGMRLGNSPKHTLTIVEDDTPPVVKWVGGTVNASELAGTIGLQLILNHPTTNALTVPLSTSGAGATDITVPASVTIPAGASTAFVAVTIAPNTGVTADQAASITMSAPVGGTVGAPASLTLNILDQDTAVTPGRRWTLQQQKPVAEALSALTTIPGATPRVVAVGDAGAVATSDDHGATWTKRFSQIAEDEYYLSVHWNGSFLVAPGSHGHVGLSPDGILWRDLVVPQSSTSMYLNDAASNSARTVIVGARFEGQTQVPVIYSSKDIVHWSQNTLPPGLMGNLHSVIYVSGTTSEFVAVGSDYNFDTKKATTLILTSQDGLSWTDRSAALLGVDLTSVVNAGGTLVAFDSTKSAYSGIIAPSDGSITWTKRTLGTLGGLAYGEWDGSKLVAVGEATGTTTNGTTWVEKASPSKNTFSDITWSGQKFIAVAQPNGIYVSNDGVAWTKPASAENPLTLISVAWSGNQFCAVGGDFNRTKTALIYTSPDGLAWTQQSTTVKAPLLGVAWSGTVFCAVGANGTIITSPTGAVWTTRVSGTVLDLHDVTWGSKQFVVVGGNETNEDGSQRAGGSILLTSKDGTTWTRRPIPTGHVLEGVTYNPLGSASPGPYTIPTGMYVAVGRSTSDGGGIEAEVLTSYDGISWAHQSSGIMNQDFQRVSYGAGLYIATSSNFGIATSIDGIHWNPISNLPAAPALASATALHGLTSAGGQMIAVGDNGTILSSADGYTWTSQVSQFRGGSIFGICASPSTIVAVGSNASIQTSVASATVGASRVSFLAQSSTVQENVGTANVFVTMNPPPAVATPVVFHATATGGLTLKGPGADVTVPTSPLIFNPGESVKTISIAVTNDNLAETGEGLTLTLDSAPAGVILGPNLTHALTIMDDDLIPVATGSGPVLVLAGTTITLSSNLTSPQLTYLWKKNGASLPPNVIGVTSPRLRLDNLATTDGGTYTCLISNDAGSTTITVPVGVYKFVGAPLPYGGTTTATLTQPGSSNLIYHWYPAMSNTEIPASADFVYNANKSTLTVKNLAAHVGGYVCKVELAAPHSMPIIQQGYSYSASVVTAAPTIAPLTLPAGVIGTPYVAMAAPGSGSSTINFWSSPDLASVGLSINPFSGQITGMPSAVVTNKVVTITVTNDKGSTSIKPTISITSGIAAFVGTHTGMMQRDFGVNNNLGGIITVTVSANGSCTGSYTVNGVKTSIAGTAIANSPTAFSVIAFIGNRIGAPLGKTGKNQIMLTFSYDTTITTGASGQGSLNAYDPDLAGSSMATFRTWRSLAGAANIAPFIGRWNLALRLGNLSNGDPSVPQGHGFGNATVAATGLISYSGKLSDGTAFTASAPLNQDGSGLLYTLLYGGKGSLMAVPAIDNAASVDSTITDMAASWNKPEDNTPAGARNYPDGWSPLTLALEGAKYKYVAGTHVMGLTVPTSYPYWNASLSFSFGGTQATLPSPDVLLDIDNNGMLIDPPMTSYGINPRNASFFIATATGSVTGTLNMNEMLGNGTSTTTRGAVPYNAQIVRIYDSGTAKLIPQAVGYILLPQLPNLNQSPIELESAVPILSGRVEVTKYP